MYFNPRVIVCKRSGRNSRMHGVQQATSVHPLLRRNASKDHPCGSGKKHKRCCGGETVNWAHNN
jgi:hypothetical protein